MTHLKKTLLVAFSFMTALGLQACGETEMETPTEERITQPADEATVGPDTDNQSFQPGPGNPNTNTTGDQFNNDTTGDEFNNTESTTTFD